MRDDGGWVFISHSHLDIEVVRRIRNALENQGFEPLLFFLKCLNDEDEIESLIRREIEEREWFIYVESDNSKKSRWVKSERDYIASLDGKKVFTIDINANINEQVRHITRQLKVYIPYTPKDAPIYRRIRKILAEREYLVLGEEKLSVGTEMTEVARSVLDGSAREGFVLLLVSENTTDSQWVREEIEYVLKKRGKVIPVYIGDAALEGDLLQLLGENQGVNIDTDPTEEQLESIVSEIEHRITYYRSDFTVSSGFLSARTIQYPPVGTIPAYTFWDCTNLETVTIPSCVSYISDEAFRKDQDVLVICDKDSCAERFCIRHGIRYQLNDG